MQSFRCHHCKWILYNAEGDIDTEVICPKCRRVNYPARVDQGFGLRGKDFQAKSVDHICFRCRKLLLRSIGIGALEIQCYWCSKQGYKDRIIYDTQKMREGRFQLPKTTDERYLKMQKTIAR